MKDNICLRLGGFITLFNRCLLFLDHASAVMVNVSAYVRYI